AGAAVRPRAVRTRAGDDLGPGRRGARTGPGSGPRARPRRDPGPRGRRRARPGQRRAAGRRAGRRRLALERRPSDPRAMRIGIIPGSGTSALPALDAGAPAPVATPFGEALVSEGRFAGADVLHVSRHGDGHRRLSSAVTHQANIWALRERGAQAILAVTVCGA